MPSTKRIVSKFDVCDNEVQEFINNICTQTSISEQGLTECFYTRYVNIFVIVQYEALKERIASYQKENPNNCPQVSTEEFIQYKSEALDAILPEIIKYFAKDNASLEQTVTRLFNDFKTKCIDNHRDFAAIQAEAFIYVHEYFNQNPPASDEEAAETVVNKIKEFYQTVKINKPQFIEQIDTHNKFMEEHIELNLTMMEVIKSAKDTLAVIDRAISFFSRLQPAPTAIPRNSQIESQAPSPGRS